MSLEKVNKEVDALVKRWEKIQPSAILDHGKMCCKMAREWLLAMDLSLRVNDCPICAPRWIRERYEWGPSHWPLYWCEVEGSNMLDCVALAALAREIFLARGVIAFPVQLVQQFSEQDLHHWRKKWLKAGQSPDWIIGTHVYHEACAVVVHENYIKIWDPTDNFWIYPDQYPGYGATLAIRVIAPFSAPNILVWGNHQIIPNQWIMVCRVTWGFLPKACRLEKRHSFSYAPEGRDILLALRTLDGEKRQFSWLLMGLNSSFSSFPPR